MAAADYTCPPTIVGSIINAEMKAEERVNLKMFHKLSESDSLLSSPININVVKAEPLKLSRLVWRNYDKIPKKMKLTNSGQTLILSAKWFSERPYLSGGPLKGKYVFSQAHFHWGKNALEGSEHTVDGTRLPLEMHVLHFKSNYLNQVDALKEKDGVICLVYFFNITSNHNPTMHRIVSEFPSIKLADTAIGLEPFIITELMHPFEDDFYLYWGAVNTKECSHGLMWLITREVTRISAEQLRLFRLLLDPQMRPIRRNFRDLNPVLSRKLFLINPATPITNSTLSPIPLPLSGSSQQYARKNTLVCDNDESDDDVIYNENLDTSNKRQCLV